MGDADKQLAEWLNGVKWRDHLNDPVVKALVLKLRTHLDGGEDDGIGADDIVDAPRVKLVVVGDGAVGKTSLLICFAKGQFPEDYLPTVFENYTAQLKRESGLVLLHLWDTAGQEDYDRLRPLSYPGADVVLLCYNTISQASFEAVEEKWAPEIAHYIEDVPKMLVGTKVDLREAGAPDPNTDKVDPVTTAAGAALAKSLGAVHMEISSKTGKNLLACFEKAVEIALAHRGDIPGAGAGASRTIGGARTRKTKKNNTCILL